MADRGRYQGLVVAGLIASTLAVAVLGFRLVDVRPLVIKGSGKGGEEASNERRPRGGLPSVKQQYLIALPEDDANRFLRTTVVVELSTTEDRDALQHSMTKVGDAFISTSTDHTVDDFAGREGMESSRELMRAAIKQVMPDLDVRGVYFTEFVLR